MCAPPSEPSARFLPADTVIDSGRLLRRPMDEWVSEIVARLRSLSGETLDLETIPLGCAALNSAGLAFVYSSQSAVAGDVCQSQLDWLGTFRGGFPAAELATLAIHPWVNLGRLCRRAGDCQRALEYFRSINGTQQAPTIRFERWECIPTDSFRQIADPLRVYEILRTHLQTGDLDEALEFATQLDDSIPMSARMLKMELLIHVHLRRGEPAAAVTLMKAMPWPQDHFGVLAQQYYSAVALAALEQFSLAVKALKRMAPHWIGYLSRPERDARDLRLAIELCRLAKHLDCRELFSAFFLAAASAVVNAREVLLASQLLQLGKLCAYFEIPAQLEDFTQRFGYKTTPVAASALSELRFAISQVLRAGERALCA